jgi:hypothetical protein
MGTESMITRHFWTLTDYQHEGNPEVMTSFETPCALDINMHSAQMLINTLFFKL